MASVKFLQGTRAQYAAITPDINTFYAVTETDGKVNFYLGSLQLSQQAAIDVLNGADTVPGSVANAIKVAIADIKINSITTVVTELPTTNINSNTIYFLKKSDGTFKQYMYVENSWVKIGGDYSDGNGVAY